MAANRHDPPDLDQLKNPEVGHEPSEINTRAIVKSGIAFVVLGIITLFLVAYVFDVFRTREQSAKGRPRIKQLDVDARQLPPEPRLQPAPVMDLKQMRAAEDEILNGYGWADRANGVVRIPVSRAMELIARDGLPARAGAAPQSASTATVPRESGLGPIVHQAGGPLSPNRSFPGAQPLQIHGNGSPFDGRAAGGPPTPPAQSLANTGPAPAAEAPPIGPSGTTQHGIASTVGSGDTKAPAHTAGAGQTPGTIHHGEPEQQQKK